MRYFRNLCPFLILLLVCSCFSCGKPTEEPLLEIICLDVGQGDCTLLRTPDGDILVDAGSESSQETLCRRLHALGVSALKLFVLTHPDEDHIGGGDGIIGNFAVETVWVNSAFGEGASMQRLTDTLSAQKIPVCAVRAGESRSFGETVITVLSPNGALTESDNESGLVLTVHCGSFVFLTMGDAGEATERELLRDYGPAQLRADVLHVGHHGSNSSTGSDFLNAVSPQTAIISCGAGNSYGHPDGRTLSRLESAGAEIYRTDLLGEIRITVDRNGYRIG